MWLWTDIHKNEISGEGACNQFPPISYLEKVSSEFNVSSLFAGPMCYNPFVGMGAVGTADAVEISADVATAEP